MNQAPTQRDSNLLAMLPSIYEYFGAELFQTFATGHPGLSRVTEQSQEEVIAELFKTQSNNLIGQWNHLAAHIAFDSATPEMVRQVQDISYEIQSDQNLDHPEWILNTQIRPSYIPDNEYYEDERHMFEVRLLKNSNNPQAIQDTYGDFIRWHCNKYLTHKASH